MLQAAEPTKDVEKLRRSAEIEQTRKRQRKEPVTFADPNSLVTFIIGEKDESTKFTIHKEVGCCHSKVLDAAFNSDFVEGQTQTYRLEDTID
ncbi:hypothetical protein N431DRAFT_457876 [Stipitochalara longipes BDJ]|nr:hypothetical protein N431DRAFT_457876 [Stipitochalara longipes BDJ]